MPTSELLITTEPPPDQVQFLEDRIYEFNSGATGIADGEWLAIFVKDEEGRIVAGICGNTWGGCLEVRQFWVEEARRKKGLGTRLLGAAEEEARQRGCRQILLMTFTFQAPAFYAKHGFEVIAMVEDHPRGHKNLLMRKRLGECGRSAKPFDDAAQGDESRGQGARVIDGRSETTSWMIRRLLAADAAAYQALRLEGFTRHPLQFRVAPEDESGLSLQAVGERLEGTFIAGGFAEDRLVGIAGLTRFEGAKLRHRALLWGMYVRERERGGGLGHELMRILLAEARSQGIEQVILTVAAENDRARHLYERWGFFVYGTEPGAIKSSQGFLDEALMICRVT